MTVPDPTICRRSQSEEILSDLIRQGCHPVLASLLSGRLEQSINLRNCLAPMLGMIDDPIGIADMDAAVARIVKAIRTAEVTILAVDHDLDGQASAAVLWCAMVHFFGVDPTLLTVVSSHRLTEGYGITDPVADRIIESPATLIISADKGSSDEARIARIAATGKDVIVTDHHEVPQEGPPASALACVNPTRRDSKYDPFICGASVAFLTMTKVRSELMRQGIRRDIESLTSLLDYVAVATIADCVALRPDRTFINRAFVKRGLALIRNGSRPCWQVFCTDLNEKICDSQVIAFRLAPAVAAAGRLDWAEVGFRFLVSESIEEARVHWETLKQENELRKTIEKRLRETALAKAMEVCGQSIVLYLEDGHSGVHGITASRLVEAFGKPVGIFSPRGAGARDSAGQSVTTVGDDQLLSGSFRGVPSFNVRDALQDVHDQNPGLFIGFGGHVGAAGATIRAQDFNRFADGFEEAVKKQMAERLLRPEIWVDGELKSDDLSLETVDLLATLDPWGKDFPVPAFLGTFTVRSVSAAGDGTHLRLGLEMAGRRFAAIWFNAIASRAPLPVEVNKAADLVFRIGDNRFRGERRFQLTILCKASERLG